MNERKKLFFPGQEVTPKRPGSWQVDLIVGEPEGDLPVPKFGGVYHVGGYDDSFRFGDIWLVEFGECEIFPQEEFVPVISSHKLENMLTEVFEEQTV